MRKVAVKPKRSAPEKCSFETEAFAKKHAKDVKKMMPEHQTQVAHVTGADFKKKMDDLMKTGAESPTEVSMSDWYYMRDHGKECPRCARKFKRLAAQNPEVDGPKALC